MTRGFAAALAACAALGAIVCASAQALPDGARSYDRTAYGQAYGEIAQALHEGDFARLERMHGEFLGAGARTTDGTWMVQAFEEVFAMLVHEPPVKVERLFREWAARDPASALRPIAEAFAWQRRAWHAKGSGCYPAASSSSRKAFNTLLERAAAALREGETLANGSPLWHTAVMLVAGGQGRPAAELDSLLEESARRFPAYEPLYSARLLFLLPEWQGDYDRADRFIRDSAARTAPLEGRAFYAWLYLDLARLPGCKRLFDESRVSWPDMKAAFEDMLERHPDVWNKNLFATFACRARDVETTRRQLGELGAAAKLGAWSRGISNDTCYRMIGPALPKARVSGLAGEAADFQSASVSAWSAQNQGWFNALHACGPFCLTLFA